MTKSKTIIEKVFSNGWLLAICICLIANELELFGMKVLCSDMHSDTIIWIAILVILFVYTAIWCSKRRARQTSAILLGSGFLGFMIFSGCSFSSLHMVFDSITNGAFCSMHLVRKDVLDDGQILCQYSDGAAGKMIADISTLEKPIGAGFSFVKTLKKVSPFRR